MKVRVAIYFLILGTLSAICGCALRAESGRTNTNENSASSLPSPAPGEASTSTSTDLPTSTTGASAPPSLTPRKRLAHSVISDPASTLYFTNQRSGWVLLGDALYGTNDGGETWVRLNQRPLRSYNKIIFVTELKGYALQDDWNTEKRSSTILSTSNGGRAWRKILELPTPVSTINFVKDQVGYVVGRWYPIHRTADGGKTWRAMGGVEGLNYLYFTSEKEGWGYGGAIWRTEDGGETWSQVVPYEQVADLWDAKFIDRASGWMIGGRQQLWVTSDGRTWRQVVNLPVSQKRLVALDFVNDEGWIASEDGLIIHTRDRGATWQVIATLEKQLSAIKFNDELKGWAVGKRGEFFRTKDGGANWEIVSLKAE